MKQKSGYKTRNVNGYKRIRAILLFALLGVTMSLLFMNGETAGFDNSSMQETGGLNAIAPKIQAEAAEIYCNNLEQPVYQKNADKRIDPYSITKILSCYLAIENLELGEVVKVSKYAATPLEDGTTIYLKEGERISVEDLLYGAMLESGNDAARALAEAVSGSEKDFAELMNNTAKGWGCENTHFVNSNGWKDDDHYTTAHDMAVITTKSFENEKLREISMTKEHVIPETNMTEERHLSSHTLSGKMIEGMTGGKTGGWTKEDTSFAATFSYGDIEGTAVVLKTELRSRRKDIAKLIKFSQSVTPGYIVAEAGDKICDAMVRGGAKTKTALCIDETIYAYPKNHNREGIRIKLERSKIQAPVIKGENVGTYTVYVDDKNLHTGKLIASEDIDKGWMPSYFYIPNKITVLLGISVLLYLMMFLLIGRIIVPSRKQNHKGFNGTRN